jgi:hypothetical protein
MVHDTTQEGTRKRKESTHYYALYPSHNEVRSSLINSAIIMINTRRMLTMYYTSHCHTRVHT